MLEYLVELGKIYHVISLDEDGDCKAGVLKPVLMSWNFISLVLRKKLWSW